jgi:rubrerythrin
MKQRDTLLNFASGEMRHLGDFDKLYFERKGKNVKKLIEEAVLYLV